MCRAAPALVTRVEGQQAWVQDQGQEMSVSLLGLSDVKAGDYVYYHAGLALQRLDPQEAREILEALNELEALLLEDDLLAEASL